MHFVKSINNKMALVIVQVHVLLETKIKLTPLRISR